MAVCHTLLGLALLVGSTSAQYVCPMQWEPFEQQCYKFVMYPQKDFNGALADCARQQSALVSVNSLAEHSFIKQKIVSLEIWKGDWYTSGEIRADGRFRWNGDGSYVDMSPNSGYWVDSFAPGDVSAGNYLVYGHKNLDYGLMRARSFDKINYICEIPLVEVYKVLQDDRGLDYGMDFVPTLSEVDRGPKFLVDSKNTVVVGIPKQAYVECVATAKPPPTYLWKNGTTGTVVVTGGQELSSSTNNRYTLTNGRLTFTNPDRGLDTAKYQCLASNTYGTILSNPIQVSFGRLGEFPNVGQDAVNSYAHKGAQIECPKITYEPAIRYQWAKESPIAFVRPLYSKYIFISMNSKLYFSEVTDQDQGYYYCVVSLTRPANTQSYIGSALLPSATAIKIMLIVQENAGGQNKPEILDDFIYVSPQNPKRGDSVSLECFAYGTPPLQYSWVREGRRQMPIKSRQYDHGRVLWIESVTEDDAGSYRCYVYSTSTRQSDTKSFTLSIQSKPYFRIPLHDQLVDKGSQLTWRCYASATPPGIYSWFKNGEPLQSDGGSMVVSGNTLLIRNLQEEHNGMYQCAVTNQYGTAFSSAQLRVLEFAPSFKKQALPGTFYATLGGNSSIPCRPEAAPFPDFRWYQNGRDLGLTLGDTTSRVRLLPGGDLLITDVQNGDAGRYRCEAENSLGKDSVEGSVVVLRSTTITQAPQPRTVVVNDTAFFFCRASYSNALDMIYIWRFNGRPLDVEGDPYYSWGSGLDSGGLYIRNAQFKHEGEYTCVARTQSDEVTRSAYLTVDGPPGPAGGVYADRTSLTTRGIRLIWIPGDNHGSPVQTFIIEGATNFEDFKVWRVLKDNIIPNRAVDTADPDTNRRTTVLTTLTPGTGYKFRVRAQNRFGLGTPSDPSSIYQTEGAPPTKVVEEVGGGGGKVGDLTVTWKPLEPVDHHGRGIGYNVYWRRKGPRVTDVDWEMATISGNASRFVANVGQIYYYTEYEVKVRAYNILGPGPNSSVQVIFSAEDLPSGTPGTPWGDGFNATCLRIYWKPVPDTRQQMKGKLLGYKINYWKTDTQLESQARQGILHGQRDSGLIIGLDPDTFYSFTVQVYNTAGNGPKSDEFRQTTFTSPPLSYPTEVALHSVTEDTIEVRWRGVSTHSGEEPLQGYKIRYWVFGTDIRNASDVVLGRVSRGRVTGLQRNVLYMLRVLGYSRGGDGKMSMPPLLFSMENSQIRYDLTQTELLAGSSHLLPSLLSLIAASIIRLLVC